MQHLSDAVSVPHRLTHHSENWVIKHSWLGGVACGVWSRTHWELSPPGLLTIILQSPASHPPLPLSPEISDSWAIVWYPPWLISTCPNGVKTSRQTLTMQPKMVPIRHGQQRKLPRSFLPNCSLRIPRPNRLKAWRRLLLTFLQRLRQRGQRIQQNCYGRLWVLLLYCFLAMILIYMRPKIQNPCL